MGGIFCGTRGRDIYIPIDPIERQSWEKIKNMSRSSISTAASIAAEVGVSPEEFTQQLAHPIFGSPLHTTTGAARHFPLRAHAPLLDGSPHPGDSDPNFPRRPRAEPHDDVDEAATDPLSLRGERARVRFPSGKRI